MQLKNQPNFSVFILLILRSFTVAVSAHYNVSVICDSYGVLLDWKSSELSQEKEFVLELRDDDSKVISINTSNHQYNISDELRTTTYNRFYVNVMVRGKNKSAQSPIFSFCSFKSADIICDLEFPPIILGPQDGQLSVTFVNPLLLYQKTPALRNIGPNEKLHYQVKGKQTSDEFICSSDSKVCKSTLSFPEVEAEYCVTVSGYIRQTPFKEHSQCYRGTLNPGPPVLTYIIPLLVGLPAVAILVLVGRTLTKAIDRKMKKKHIAKIPAFLSKDDRLPHTQFTLLPSESMPITEITKVNLYVDLKIPPICDFPESTDLQKTPANSKQIMDSTDETDDDSDNTEQEDEAFYKDPYGDMSSGGFTGAYDRPHALLEMSPGDLVSTYGTRPFLD